MNKKKDVGKKPDTAIIVAIIALVGTLITALLSSPVIVALISKTPSPTISITSTETILSPSQIAPTPNATVTATTPNFFSTDGKIAFVSNKGNSLGLYLLYIVDKSVVPLPASLTGSIGRFKWSPDGKKILYSSDTGLYIVDTENYQSNLLTEKALVFAFAWSPSSAQVALGNDKGIYLIDTATKNYQLLTSLVLEVSGVTDAIAWSPDGNEIAFSAWENAGNNLNLYLINPNGSNLRNLSALNQWGNNDGNAKKFSTYNLAWSPNSEYLAVMSEHAILLIGRDGMSRTLYSNENGADTMFGRINWSPDSTKIIFNDKYNVIRIINITDGVVSTLPLNGVCPSWLRDGKSIIFVAPGMNSNEIFLTNDNGTEKLTDNMQVECAKSQP
jgi:Tol biopolymer transport system component